MPRQMFRSCGLAFRLLPILCALLGTSSALEAQEVYRGTDIGGLQSGRAYYSPSDWESFDTKTGNLVLTFTDLVLPGYAGHDVIFQRTYNNQPVPGSAGPPQGRWTFGFPGMVMRVIDPDWDGTQWHAVSPLVLTTFAERLAHTPRFLMADGSERRTMYWEAQGPQQDDVWSSDFLEFSRIPDAQLLRHLQMPDGTQCDYDANGWLVHYLEPHGMHVWLDRSVSDHITITQAMGTEVRQVVEVLNGNGWVISMTYANRTWSYAYDGNHMDVAPPTGPGWHFEWDSGGWLSQVQTPLGGTIAYTYADHENPFSAPSTVHVLTARTMWSGAPNTSTALGTWTVSLYPGVWDSVPLAPATFIVTPSGSVHRYEHFSNDPGETSLGAGTGPVVEAIERGLDYYWLERVDTTYSLETFFATANGGVPRPHTIHTSHREFDSATAEQTSTALISYAGTLYHLPTNIQQWFSDAPPRVIQRSYNGFFYPYSFLIGSLSDETVTVGGQEVSSLHRQWTNPSWLHYTSETLNGITTSFTPAPLGNVGTATTTARRSPIPTSGARSNRSLAGSRIRS